MSWIRTTRADNYKSNNTQDHDSKVISLRCRECRDYLKCKETDRKPDVGYGCFKKRRI